MLPGGTYRKHTEGHLITITSPAPLHVLPSCGVLR
jgi:hypothetical protein